MSIVTSDTQEIPVEIVGSSNYGRYPMISAERTYNMFIDTSSDGKEQWLTNFAGYKAIKEIAPDIEEGRGLFHSIRGQFLLFVIADNVYRLNTEDDDAVLVGSLGSTIGEVYVDENLSSQICIVDGVNPYIYNYLTGDFAVATLTNPVGGSFDPADFKANYVTYQNTYFVFGNGLTTNAGSQWYIFQKGTGNTELVWVQTLTLQTKPDFAKGALRIPGKGNNLLVFGSSVAEIWTNVGGLQVYQRNSTINIDYGVSSVATIAAADEFVVWLGINESSAPVIMVMSGS